MTLLEWKDEFKIGIEEVDFEHQELIELINESFAEVERANSSTAVMDFLGEIFEKISAHFALEEKVMKSFRYEDYEEHKRDHERLLDSIRDIMDEFMLVEKIDEKLFGQQLRDWFINHFSTHDAQLHHRFPH